MHAEACLCDGCCTLIQHKCQSTRQLRHATLNCAHVDGSHTLSERRQPQAEATRLRLTGAGPSEAYYRLWPASFDSVAARESLAALIPPLCKALVSAAVVYSSVGGGRWLAPRDALFLDDRSARYSLLLPVAAE